MRYAIAWLDGVLASSLLPFLGGEVSCTYFVVWLVQYGKMGNIVHRGKYALCTDCIS